MKSPYLTMGDLLRIYRISEATGRRWAREDAWRRTASRPVRYSLADAQRSYEERHVNRVARHLATRYGDSLDSLLDEVI